MTRSRDDLLLAAAEVAGSRGYINATIEAVAGQAGVAKQTIYRRWPNKAVLFIDVYQHLLPGDLADTDTDVDTGSLESDLRALLGTLSQQYAHSPAGNILAGLIADAQADPALARQLRETYVLPRRGIIRSILDRAVRRGEIGKPAGPDPDFLSDLFSGAVWFRLLLGERQLDDAFTDDLVQSMLRLTRHGPD